MFDLSDRVAIITGAAGNLGQATVVAYTEAGAKVTLVDRKPDRLGALFPELVDSPDHLLVASVDGVVAEAVERMVAGTIERFGGIDILVNTVGGYRAGTPVHKTALEVWDQMFDLNLRPTVISCRAVVPHMIEQERGRIINVAARAGLKGASDMAAYSASKSAVIRLTESMASELWRDGINVNCVLPGVIDTPQYREAMPKMDHRRWVKPETIAKVMLFLASDTASSISGAALPV